MRGRWKKRTVERKKKSLIAARFCFGSSCRRRHAGCLRAALCGAALHISDEDVRSARASMGAEEMNKALLPTSRNFPRFGKWCDVGHERLLGSKPRV